MKTSLFNQIRGYRVMLMAVAIMLSAALPAQGAGELAFTAVEKDGAKVWDGGGAIDGRGPVTLTVKNTLGADHGFSIDTMNVSAVLKPGEEKTITVPLAQITTAVSAHRVYCQLHPKHVAATIMLVK